MSFCLMSAFVLTFGSSEAREAAQRVREVLQDAEDRGWLNWLDPQNNVTYRLPRMTLSVADYQGLINAGHQLPSWDVLLAEQRLAIEHATESSDTDTPGRGRGPAAPPPVMATPPVKATPPKGQSSINVPPGFKAPPSAKASTGHQETASFKAPPPGYTRERANPVATSRRAASC